MIWCYFILLVVPALCLETFTYTIVSVYKNVSSDIILEKLDRETGLVETIQNDPTIVSVFIILNNGGWDVSFTPRLVDCDSCPMTTINLSYSDTGTYTYDVSLIDGFTIPVSIVPSSFPDCKSVSCLTDINQICPINNQVLNNGQVLACAPDPVVFKEACPEVVTTVDDDGVVTCNSNSDSHFTVNFNID